MWIGDWSEGEGSQKGDCEQLWKFSTKAYNTLKPYARPMPNRPVMKKKKDVKGKSNASNNAAATADSQEDEPFEED
jgi:hypothetical protein